VQFLEHPEIIGPANTAPTVIARDARREAGRRTGDVISTQHLPCQRK
jgi:hypothetical protein